MRRLIAVGLTVLCGALALAQAPASEGPTLTPIWDLKGDFAADGILYRSRNLARSS